MAAGLAANGSMTAINLKGNQLGDEGWGAIFAGVCSSTVSKIASINASAEGLRPEGAKLMAEALRTSVNASLTRLDMKYSALGEEGEAVLREATEGRSGFELLL